MSRSILAVFFFQAEDGIRDLTVTGVQTCALPIFKPEFDRRNTKVLGLSADPVSDHAGWVNDIQETQGHAVNYPLIGDADLTVAKLYDMIHPNASGGKRTAVENATVRSVFVIGPDKKVKAMIAYPKIGRASCRERV